MRILVFIVLLILYKYAGAQSAIVGEIKRINPVSKNTYRFPKIFIENDTTASTKINYTLRAELLSADTPTSDNDIFNQVWNENNRIPSSTYIDFEVVNNNKGVLSIRFEGEGCGAYCEEYKSYYTFNVKTGNQISLDSLFTKAGMLELSKKFAQYKKRKLLKKIKAIHDTLNTTVIKSDKEMQTYYGEMLSLYAECLNSDYELSDFEIIQQQLIIHTDRCSAHYNRNVDELWTFDYAPDIKSFAKFMTAYGRSILLPSKKRNK
jgi:hypothetical protein